MAHIRPGLERIHRLLADVKLPWKNIHVAGTNGKGSVCAYLSAMLHESNIYAGRFTSPHLIDRWDCITINEKPVSESIFLEVEDQIKWRNEKGAIEATSFELLTATAYEIFNREKIKVGVVECGMGGKSDATNVFTDPLVTVITRLGLDHMAFLGSDPWQIANEKAGIMRQGTPCVVDSYSGNPFLKSIENAARKEGVKLYLTPMHEKYKREIVPRIPNEYDRIFDFISPEIPYTKVNNMWTAYRAFSLAMQRLNLKCKDFGELVKIMDRTVMPGRYQKISIEPLTGRHSDVLLDGAHNEQAMSAVVDESNAMAGATNKRPVWVVGLSKGRNPQKLFANFEAVHRSGVEAGHNIPSTCKVIVVEFGPVAGMPWVEPAPREEWEPILQENKNWHYMGADLAGALRLASSLALEGPMIITGSLYLVSDVLRMMRDAKHSPPPTRSREETEAPSKVTISYHRTRQTQEGTIAHELELRNAYKRLKDMSGTLDMEAQSLRVTEGSTSATSDVVIGPKTNKHTLSKRNFAITKHPCAERGESKRARAQTLHARFNSTDDQA